VFGLLKFKAEQKVLEISGFRVGGQPGELPTALIGNVFYKGMPEVADHREGAFEKKSVLKWIGRAEELSERTGVPHFLDIMAMYPAAMRKYVEFVSELDGSVFLIDGTNPETRVAGLETVRELGLHNRTIYNAIFPQSRKKRLRPFLSQV